MIPNENPGKEATRAFMTGAAGCLGVGAAIIMVIIVLAILGAVVSHH